MYVIWTLREEGHVSSFKYLKSYIIQFVWIRYESCRFPSFIFLPFFPSFFFSAPVASKGVDNDLSAYIPGKNKKVYKGFVMKPNYSRKHTHFWSYITLQIPLLTTSF